MLREFPGVKEVSRQSPNQTLVRVRTVDVVGFSRLVSLYRQGNRTSYES